MYIVGTHSGIVGRLTDEKKNWGLNGDRVLRTTVGSPRIKRTEGGQSYWHMSKYHGTPGQRREKEIDGKGIQVDIVFNVRNSINDEYTWYLEKNVLRGNSQKTLTTSEGTGEKGILNVVSTQYTIVLLPTSLSGSTKCLTCFVLPESPPDRGHSPSTPSRTVVPT